MCSRWSDPVQSETTQKSEEAYQRGSFAKKFPHLFELHLSVSWLCIVELWPLAVLSRGDAQQKFFLDGRGTEHEVWHLCCGKASG